MPRSNPFRGNTGVLNGLLIKQDFKCYYCEIEMTLRDYRMHRDRSPTIDHKIALCEGGEPFGSNVVASCLKCNNAKGPLPASLFFVLRRDPKALKQAKREAHQRLEQMTREERKRRNSIIKARLREDLRAAQIELGPFIREHRGRGGTVDVAVLKTAEQGARAGSTPVARTRFNNQWDEEAFYALLESRNNNARVA